MAEVEEGRIPFEQIMPPQAIEFFATFSRAESSADQPLAVAAGRGNVARHGGGGDSREPKLTNKPRDMYVPDLHIDTLKLKARNFR